MTRRVTYLVLTAVIAAVAGLLVRSALRYQAAQIQSLSRGHTSIVVAAKRIGPGVKVEATALHMVSWPVEHLPPGAITDPRKALGRITKVMLVENQPLLESALVEEQKRAGMLPLMIPAGMRAMSIPVDEVADMAGFVLPSTRVDIVVAVQTGSDSMTERSRIVLQDIQVAAVAQELESEEGQPRAVKVVTLFVTPSQAEVLALASHMGTLRLVMRNFGDAEIVHTEGAAGSDLVGEKPSEAHPQIGRQQAIVVRPRPSRTLEIIRDGKKHQLLSFIDGKKVNVDTDDEPVRSGVRGR